MGKPKALARRTFRLNGGRIALERGERGMCSLVAAKGEERARFRFSAKRASLLAKKVRSALTYGVFGDAFDFRKTYTSPPGVFVLEPVDGDDAHFEMAVSRGDPEGNLSLVLRGRCTRDGARKLLKAMEEVYGNYDEQGG